MGRRGQALGREAELTKLAGLGQWRCLWIHTYVEQTGEEIIRIISARKATRRERAIYEEEN